jgi:hypothetical protein
MDSSAVRGLAAVDLEAAARVVGTGAAGSGREEFVPQIRRSVGVVDDMATFDKPA